eukprot:scaffold38976_cov63-Phaeocystis_antarctica.AAC.3
MFTCARLCTRCSGAAAGSTRDQQEIRHDIPQPLPQEVSESLRLELRLRLRELPLGQVKRMLIAHVRHCRNRWRCGTCCAARVARSAYRQPPGCRVLNEGPH